MKIGRREFLKRAGLAGGALAATGLAARLYRNRVGRDFDEARTERLLDSIQPVADPASLPNIVVIMADDLGYGDLGAYGSELIQTPAIDSLAADGVRLTNFYACAAVCTPSRVGMLTGRYPKRTLLTLPLYPKNHHMEYVLKLVDRYQYDVTGIPTDEATLAELLGRRGYRTGLVGKWHLGDQPGHKPGDNGFDSFYGALYSNNVAEFAIWRNDEIDIPSPVDQNQLTPTYTREAIEFIRASAGGAFFLYLAHTAVHEPLFVGDEFRGTSPAGLYGDAVAELDWSTGQILATLAELGLAENTLVLFTSDNGPWWQGSPGRFRGRKNNIADGGLRVPLLARWPARIPAGITNDELAVNFDIFATCLAMAGVDLPTDRIIDGQDILPLLRGEAASPHEQFYYYDGPILAAVRDRKWKYQRRHMSDNGGYPIFNQGPFLFDLENDPAESYNLIGHYPEVAEEFVYRLDMWELAMEANQRGWL